ncbi:hypothetical protein EC845_1174 [Comamonas sp. BIGb0124]|uniref:hypothetical protein n=1 Tax=Comamonas sp. BIGb0124 TaxID=2485130 RepID=UPI000FB5959C|nr:hypothetical protein [Comamonas sp. BIGb0124]ROR25134.1 hypothetical protein EC845_1174 [Comamonas sp. BIGb0124]
MIGTQRTGNVPGVVISAVSHEGLSVTVDGRPARLAIVTEDGQVIAAGDSVAKEAEAVAVNNYRNFLKGQGFLRILSKPIEPSVIAEPIPKRAAPRSRGTRR